MCLSIRKFPSSYITPVLFQNHKITASHTILSWKDHEDDQSSAPGPSIQVVNFSDLYFAQITTQKVMYLKVLHELIKQWKENQINIYISSKHHLQEELERWLWDSKRK